MRQTVALLVAFCLCLGGCGGGSPVRRSTVCMDTAVTLTLYDGTDADVDACLDRLRAYEALFSRTDPQSEVSRLNAAGGEAVALSPDTAALLQLGREWGARTDGALDITIAPARSLWDFSTPVLPDADALAAAAARVDYRQLTVTDTGAALPAGCGVDAGAIAKGYAADKLAALLQERGVASALLDLGGNILAIGDKEGRPFTVGVRSPFTQGALIARIPARDCAVVTSGTYERGFTLDGVRYHHILDPATGWPVQNGLASVTVVTASAGAADALSTACFVMGRERGAALIETLDGVEALFVTDDGTLYPTSGLDYEPV